MHSRTRTAHTAEPGPVPLPRAHLDEIIQFYHDRVAKGQPVEEIRAQSRFFRPEVRQLLDRELERVTRPRTKR